VDLGTKRWIKPHVEASILKEARTHRCCVTGIA
jgi:hypothetical protein